VAVEVAAGGVGVLGGAGVGVPGEELGVAERDAGVESCEARAESRREERAPLLRRRPNLVGSMLVAGAAFWAESRPIADTRDRT
jgi:hypothetical protein